MLQAAELEEVVTQVLKMMLKLLFYGSISFLSKIIRDELKYKKSVHLIQLVDSTYGLKLYCRVGKTETVSEMKLGVRENRKSMKILKIALRN